MTDVVPDRLVSSPLAALAPRQGALSIRVRISVAFSALFFVLFAAAVAVILGGLPFSSYDGWFGRERAQAFRTLQLVADLKKHRLLEWLQAHRTAVQFMARDATIHSETLTISEDFLDRLGSGATVDEAVAAVRAVPSHAVLSHKLEAFLDIVSTAISVDLVDRRTRTVLASSDAQRVGVIFDNEALFAGLDYSQDDYISDARLLEGPGVLDVGHVVGDLRDGAPPLSAAIVMAVPAGELLRQIQVRGIELGAEGETVIVDSKGRSLSAAIVMASHEASRAPAAPLQPLSPGTPTALAVSGSEGTLETRDQNNILVLAAYRHLALYPNWTWGLVVKVERAALLATADRAVIFSIGLGLVAMGVFVVVGFLVTEHLVRPLRVLVAMTHRFASGERTIRSRIDRRDEIGALASAFDDLASRTEATLHSLEERTDDLARANASLAREATERLRAEQAQAEAVQDLQRSNGDLQQFANVVSHDLQEPLHVISGYLQVLSEEYRERLDADGREYIGHALDASDRLLRMIRSLLDYSRVETKAKMLERVETSDVLSIALDNLSAAIGERCATVVTAGDFPVLLGEPSQLIRLFQNLIGNALKYHRPGETPLVEVAVVRQGNEWLFSVRDNGIGIDPKHFERIFGVFQRLHARSEYEGTGIGLAIVRKIIERHNGRIWVESAPGQGSTFFFTLPTMADIDTDAV